MFQSSQPSALRTRTHARLKEIHCLDALQRVGTSDTSRSSWPRKTIRHWHYRHLAGAISQSSGSAPDLESRSARQHVSCSQVSRFDMLETMCIRKTLRVCSTRCVDWSANTFTASMAQNSVCQRRCVFTGAWSSDMEFGVARESLLRSSRDNVCICSLNRRTPTVPS